MRGVLYDAAWQKLRVSCLSQNHRAGGFSTAAGTQDNLNRLNQYLDPTSIKQAFDAGAVNPAVKTLDEEYRCRIWRVLNLLNATRMGFRGQGKAGIAEDQAVGQYRDSIMEQHMGGVVSSVDDRWDWQRVKEDLEVMWRNDRFWFTAIYKDLVNRTQRAGRRAQRGTQVNRPELQQFVQLLEEVNLQG
jgi:hypothetical protein